MSLSRKRRMEVETDLLAQYFPGLRVQSGEGIPEGVVGYVRTKSGQRYGLWIPTRYFPNDAPDVYVVSPVLRRHDGSLLTRSGISARMHTQAPNEHGHVQICHHSPSSWTSSMTLTKLVVKALLWLHAYEQHVQHGHPIDHYLRHM